MLLERIEGQPNCGRSRQHSLKPMFENQLEDQLIQIEDKEFCNKWYSHFIKSKRMRVNSIRSGTDELLPKSIRY